MAAERSEIDSGDSEIPDDDLIADLRDAFGFSDAGGAAPAGSQPEPGGRDEFGRVLDRATLPLRGRLGDFEILGELGRGGMGIVYRARQISLNREVALKVLPGYARYERTAVQRFRTEAQAAARLHHTNIVSIYGQGECDGHFYYAMELVEGDSLDAVIRGRCDWLSSAGKWGGSSARGRLPDHPRRRTSGSADPSSPQAAQPVQPPDWTRTDYRHFAALLAEVADALECAHRNGVIHRDVKPHNLLLGTTDHLHLTDFGLARLANEPHLTVSGEIMGTPAYLSPEQVRGDAAKIDHHTDIYSLGATLYEAITGRKPFPGETRDQVISGICTREPVAPRRINSAVPLDLETICLRAMEKEPVRRHPTAAVLAEDLRRFAEGRPILSRRTSRVEKAVKWIRRHKAVSAAVAAGMAVLALGGGWTWSMHATHRREATELLRHAYEQLTYYDYRRPAWVADDVARAEALGASPDDVHLVRAIACMGNSDPAGAVQHLEPVLHARPNDPALLYLLAWAQWTERQVDASRATFAEAEQLGPPADADTWFFRGLAAHFDQPLVAIESYREANAMRAAEHAFFPQAVLHLARARNQQLYTTRIPETFAESEASLRQLIEQNQYGSYPYYLLSIAHRLAAEIYRGSTGTRGETLVNEHYAQALYWARRGQSVEPANDRPIAAEAECLESMGRYAEAIEARTRAIEVATRDAARCECYHYRWRLRYWTGDLAGALEDAKQHAACNPQSRCYAHVYPALILAEMGRMPEALVQARALADDEPRDAQAVLWSATTLRLLGQGQEADALLAQRAGEVDFGASLVAPQTAEWVRALYDALRTGGPLDALESLADQAPAPWKLSGEAHFHAAARALVEGDRAAALRDLQEAYRSFDGEERYTYHARLLLVKMQENAAWPPWIKVSWNPASESSGQRGLVDDAAKEGSTGEEGK